MSYAGAQTGKADDSSWYDSYFNSPSALTNAGINAISFFAPPGAGLLGDFAHSAYNAYAYPGLTTQSMPGPGLQGLLANGLFGQGIGATIFNGLAGLGNWVSQLFGADVSQNSMVPSAPGPSMQSTQQQGTFTGAPTGTDFQQAGMTGADAADVTNSSMSSPSQAGTTQPAITGAPATRTPTSSGLAPYAGNMYMMGDTGFGPGIAGNMSGYSGDLGSLSSTVSGGTTGDMVMGEGGGDLAQGKQSIGGLRQV